MSIKTWWKNLGVKKQRTRINWFYFVLSIIGIVIYSCLHFPNDTVAHIIFPIIPGFLGLAMRGIYLRNDQDKPFVHYMLLYPLAIIMHGLLIFAGLSLFRPFRCHLFYAAAFPLGMYFGFLSHPGFWPIHLIFRGLADRILGWGDKPPEPPEVKK